MIRLGTLLESRPGAVIAVVATLFATAYAASLIFLPKPDGRIVIGDALHHYVQLRSAVFDGDLHFRNEYVRMYRLRGGEPGTEWVYQDTPTGHVRNLMPVGPAMLWAPAFLAVAAAAWAGHLFGWDYPLDGYGRLFQATAGLTGVVAAAIGVWLAWLTVRELFGRRAAAWSTMMLWLASSALYYSVISPTYSHAASLSATSLFWYIFVRERSSCTIERYVSLGALGGIAALMRWQDAIILSAAAIDLLWRKGSELNARQILTRGVAGLAAAIAAFSPQMFAWQIIYGTPLSIPQGEAFMRWGSPALRAVLFSYWHGLFLWTPIVAFAVAGLPILWRRDRLVFTAAVTFFLLSWYVNAAAADWWAGEAFGSRRFVSCFAVFTLGLAALIERWSPSLRAMMLAATAVVAHTFLLLVQYQAFMHGLRDVAPYPGNPFNLWVARFLVPIDLIRRWLS